MIRYASPVGVFIVTISPLTCAADFLLFSCRCYCLQLKMNVKKKKEAKQIGEELAERLNADLVHVIGHCVVVYRPRQENPVIFLASPESAETS